jgi:hypothetical protein
LQERNGDGKAQDSEPPTPHSVMKMGLRLVTNYNFKYGFFFFSYTNILETNKISDELRIE